MSQICELIVGARVVGLGEASHGDAESTALRARVIQALGERHGHIQIGFERNEEPTGRMVHSYITTGSPELSVVMTGYVMYPWQTQEMATLLMTLRQMHASGECTVEVFGFDVQSANPDSPRGHRRDALMAEVALERIRQSTSPVTLLWAHNLHLCKAPVMMGGHIAKAGGYQSVGFFFSEGSFNALPGMVPIAADSAPPGSVESVLAALEPDGTAVVASSADAAFATPMPSRHTADPKLPHFQEYPPMRDLFDVLVHFHSATPSTVLGREAALMPDEPRGSRS